MGRAKLASQKTQPPTSKKLPSILRFGYKLPQGLTVYSSTKISATRQDENGDLIPIKPSFVDMMPVQKQKDSINWDHINWIPSWVEVELADKVRAQSDQQKEETIVLSGEGSCPQLKD